MSDDEASGPIDPDYWANLGLEPPVRVNRWAAFTDDELIEISGLFLDASQADSPISMEIEAERQRRRTPEVGTSEPSR